MAPRSTLKHVNGSDGDPQRIGADIARTERIILAQSPVWIAAVGWVMLTGALRLWSDVDYLLFSVAVAAPSVVLPALFSSAPKTAGRQRRHGPYWLKLNIWVAIVVCFGTYFGTHYFFDLMGMRYAFAVRWNFASDVVGRSGQAVPLFMYPLTHAYFMTYFAVMMVAERRILQQLGWHGLPGRAAVVVGLAYSVAFAETYFMASPLLSDLFEYANRARMLTVGSLGYATYFVVGLPMVGRIDGYGEEWTLGQVVLEALATCMGILVLLEVWAKLVGPL